MTLLEAIQSRHSVRRYKDIPIAEDVISIILQRINLVNTEAGLHIQLIINEPKGFNSILNYGSFSGVKNYLVIAGKESEDLSEKAGYYGEQLVLLIQQLGLNSCWAGLTYQKVDNTYILGDTERIVCYIALGYGENQGHERKHRTAREVSNASDLTPTWFNQGVDAALLAPTAVNQQKFFIEYHGMKGSDNKHNVSIRRLFSLIGYTQIDLGIAKLHFEIGAGKEKFKWIE